MRRIHRNIASAILVSQEGKIFIAKKSMNGTVYGGMWTITGGGIEEGEDKIAAMQRETLEETGIDVSSYSIDSEHVGTGESEKTLRDTGERVICEMTFYDLRVILHDRPADSIPITLADEFDEYRWVDPAELSSYTLSPSCEKLFRDLGYIT